VGGIKIEGSSIYYHFGIGVLDLVDGFGERSISRNGSLCLLDTYIYHNQVERSVVLFSALQALLIESYGWDSLYGELILLYR